MNAADNRLVSIKKWLEESLSPLYDAREAKNISELVIQSCFGWRRADQLLNAESRLSESDILKIVPIKRRLVNSEPLQYVLGWAHFYGLDLMVNESVLIPRPETEELVNRILNSHKEQELSLLDIGTGSGCIPLAIKSERPDWNVEAYDVSSEALSLAIENSERLKLRVEFLNIDILKAEPLLNSWDIIVSNPPYIPQADKSAMAKQVLDFEPEIALFCPNDDALVFYRSIVEFAAKSLKPSGELWFEIHEGKASEVMALFDATTWESPVLFQDLQGKDRMVMGRLLGDEPFVKFMQ